MTDDADSTGTESTEPRDRFGLTRRQALFGSGALGVIGLGAATGVLTACSTTTGEEIEVTGGVPDNSREALGGQPIYDAEPFPDGAVILPPLRDRVLALKALLVGQQVIKQESIDFYVDFYKNKVGPQYGAAVVAHAWTDPQFMKSITEPPADAPFAATSIISDWLQKQGTFMVPEGPGFRLGPEGEWLRVVANGKDPKTGKRVHNMVACTVCSCYPQALLGVQPVWYKSQQYRARSVRAPRGVMAEFAEAQGPEAMAKLKSYLDGIDEVRVWDSNSEARFLVIPEMPAAWKSDTEEQLRAKITRNSMVGVEIV